MNSSEDRGNDFDPQVPLKELFDVKLGYERRGAYFLVGSAVAFGAFAWSEIQRRLVNLNHENARILAAQAGSVSADTYAANEQQRKAEQRELAEWRKDVDRDRNQSITRTEFQQESKTEKRAGIDTTTKIIGAVATAIIIFFALLNYQALHRSPAVVVPTQTVTVTTTTP